MLRWLGACRFAEAKISFRAAQAIVARFKEAAITPTEGKQPLELIPQYTKPQTWNENVQTVQRMLSGCEGDYTFFNEIANQFTRSAITNVEGC